MKISLFGSEKRARSKNLNIKISIKMFLKILVTR